MRWGLSGFFATLRMAAETNNGWKQTTAEQMTAGTNKGNSKDNSKRNGNSKRRSSAVRRMTAKNEQRQHRVTSRKPGTQD